MIESNININTFHGSKWRLTLSNIPTISKFRDLSLYELFVKDITFPGLRLETMNINFKGSQTHQVMGKNNSDFPSIDISFKADENLDNFYNLHLYMLTMKYGKDITTEMLKDNVVKSLNVLLLDNQKRTTKIFKFSNAILTDLSSLSLSMGVEEEIMFTTTWKFEEINIDINN